MSGGLPPSEILIVLDRVMRVDPDMTEDAFYLIKQMDTEYMKVAEEKRKRQNPKS